MLNSFQLESEQSVRGWQVRKLLKRKKYNHYFFLLIPFGVYLLRTFLSV